MHSGTLPWSNSVCFGVKGFPGLSQGRPVAQHLARAVLLCHMCSPCMPSAVQALQAVQVVGCCTGAAAVRHHPALCGGAAQRGALQNAGDAHHLTLPGCSLAGALLLQHCRWGCSSARIMICPYCSVWKSRSGVPASCLINSMRQGSCILQAVTQARARLCAQASCRLCCWCCLHIVSVHVLCFMPALPCCCPCTAARATVAVQLLLPMVGCSMLALSDSSRCWAAGAQGWHHPQRQPAGCGAGGRH